MNQVRTKISLRVPDIWEVIGSSITTDAVAYEARVGQNRRASLSLSGFASGAHTIELTEPSGCFAPIVVTCPAGLEKEDDGWEDGEDSPYRRRFL